MASCYKCNNRDAEIGGMCQICYTGTYKPDTGVANSNKHTDLQGRRRDKKY